MSLPGLRRWNQLGSMDEIRALRVEDEESDARPLGILSLLGNVHCNVATAT